MCCCHSRPRALRTKQPHGGAQRARHATVRDSNTPETLACIYEQNLTRPPPHPTRPPPPHAPRAPSRRVRIALSHAPAYSSFSSSLLPASSLSRYCPAPQSHHGSFFDLAILTAPHTQKHRHKQRQTDRHARARTHIRTHAHTHSTKIHIAIDICR